MDVKGYTEMRFREFVSEDAETKIRKAARQSLPHAKHLTGVDQYYHFYRLGLAMASAPDKGTPIAGPAKDNPTLWPYSDGDDEIVDKALKNQKLKGKDIVKKGGSQELPTTNTVSPVADWNK